MEIHLSVVIPVRNDDRLPEAVASVPLGVELVIAMTQPSKSTRQFAQELALTRSGVVLVETAKIGMSAGVNIGVKAASHEKIVILDSDCTLEIQTLDEYSKALDKAPFVRGTTLARKGEGWSRFAGLGQESLNKAFAHKARLIGPSIAFLKTPFLDLGGYDENLTASCDHEFVLRIEERDLVTIFAAEAVIWHQPYTFVLDCRAHLGYGRGMGYIDRKRGGGYGLGICLMRWYPAVLWSKFINRGLTSVVRSLLMGAIMLLGYVQFCLSRTRS